jgi:hypothetical protein
VSAYEQEHDYPDVPFCRQTQRRISKPRPCPSCKKMLPAGTFFVEWALVQDGEFNSGWRCARCENYEGDES